jgi:ABC-type Fe3+ transport system permease subunit
MAAKYHHELDVLAVKERMTLLRNWCLGLGLVACLIAITAIGGMSIGNPATWESAYDAMAALGALRWSVVPLFGAGILLLVVGLVFAVLAARR